MKLESSLQSLQLPEWFKDARMVLHRRWQRLAERERRLVTVAVLLAVGVFVWTFLIEPPWRTTQRLQGSLLQLQAQAAQLDAVIQEARDLRGRARTTASLTDPHELHAALVHRLQQHGLASFGAVQDTAAQTWTISLAAAPIDAMLDWLHVVPSELYLQLERVELQAAVDEEGEFLPGRVSGDITLALPGETRP